MAVVFSNGAGDEIHMGNTLLQAYLYTSEIGMLLHN